MATQSNATRRILWIVGILLVVLIILGVVGTRTGLIGGGDEGIEVETARVEVRDITQVVTASGKVQPEVEVKISPDVSGEIIELPINEGDQVERGTLLARIKPDFYQAQVEQADAGVMQARASMAQRRADMLKAEIEFKRQQELYQKQVISEADFQTAQTQLEVARAAHEAAEYAVRSAEARLEEAREQLAKTTIFAPMSGTVSQLNVELGERVVGTSQMAGTEMMRIARLDQMEMEVDVNENDVVNVSLGDTARIEIDAYPERTFRGVVTEIANSARTQGAGTQEQVTNFPVKIRILDPHNVEASRVTADRGAGMAPGEVALPDTEYPNLRPGMSGTVDVFTHTVFGALAVPIQAVTVRDVNKVRRAGAEDGEEASPDTAQTNPMKEDLRKVVFVMVGDKAEMVEVETGISDDAHIEIKSGLSGGETVIIGPYRAVSRELMPGMTVRKQEAGRRPGPAIAGQ